MITNEDRDCQEYQDLIKAIEEGVHPKTLNHQHPAREYPCIFNDLHIIKIYLGELIYFEEKLVPPKATCPKLLSLLHQTHFNAKAEWETVHQIWHWNGMKSQLEQHNRHCSSCQIDKQSKPTEKRVLPKDRLEFSPGDYLTTDIYEIDRAINITVTNLCQADSWTKAGKQGSG